MLERERVCVCLWVGRVILINYTILAASLQQDKSVDPSHTTQLTLTLSTDAGAPSTSRPFYSLKSSQNDKHKTLWPWHLNPTTLECRITSLEPTLVISHITISSFKYSKPSTWIFDSLSQINFLLNIFCSKQSLFRKNWTESDASSLFAINNRTGWLELTRVPPTEPKMSQNKELL